MTVLTTVLVSVTALQSSAGGGAARLEALAIGAELINTGAGGRTLVTFPAVAFARAGGGGGGWRTLDCSAAGGATKAGGATAAGGAIKTGGTTKAGAAPFPALYSFPALGAFPALGSFPPLPFVRT